MYKGKCWIVTTLLLMLIFYLSSCNNSNEIGTRENLYPTIFLENGVDR